MSDLNDALYRWAAEAAAQALAQYKRGDHLAKVKRGIVQQFARVEGFSVDLRSGLGGSVPIMRPGPDMRVTPVLLVRAAVRSDGQLRWAPACQRLDALLLRDWRCAETTEVRDLLAEMDGHTSPRAGGYSMSVRAAIELSPEKGR